MGSIDAAYESAMRIKKNINFYEKQQEEIEQIKKLKKRMINNVTIFMKTRGLTPLKNEKSYFPGEILKLFNNVKNLINKIMEAEKKGYRPLNLYEDLQKLVWTLELYNNELKIENKIKPYTEEEFKQEVNNIIDIISKHQNIKEGKEKFEIYSFETIKENPEYLVLLFISEIVDNKMKSLETTENKIQKQFFITRNLKLDRNKFEIHNTAKFFSKKNLDNIKKFLTDSKANIKFNIKKYLQEVYGIQINSMKKIFILKNDKKYYLVNDKILKNFLGLKIENIIKNTNNNKTVIFSNKSKKIIRIENLLYCKEEKVRKIVSEILFRGIKLNNGQIIKHKELLDKYLIFDETEIKLVDKEYLDTNFIEETKNNEELNNSIQNTFDVYKIY